jgi:hypothetical protein
MAEVKAVSKAGEVTVASTSEARSAPVASPLCSGVVVTVNATSHATEDSNCLLDLIPLLVLVLVLLTAVSTEKSLKAVSGKPVWFASTIFNSYRSWSVGSAVASITNPTSTVMVSAGVGAKVGEDDGAKVGSRVGKGSVGCMVGAGVGSVEGAALGRGEGLLVGKGVGS